MVLAAPVIWPTQQVSAQMPPQIIQVGSTFTTQQVSAPIVQLGPITIQHPTATQPHAAQQTAPATALAPGIVPLEVRTPQYSRGSAQHGTGQCRPCAWFWKPQGCGNGAECGHCHMCPEGELKARKKVKVAQLRASAPEHAQT